MNPFLRTSLVSLIFFCLVPAQAQTVAPTGATPCTGPVALSNVQRRVVETAAQGDLALIRFVHRTRMIYLLDPMETVGWLDQRRASLAACGIATTASIASVAR